MLLITHLTVAILSIIAASINLVSPSSLKLKIGSSLVALTLVSGSALVIVTHQPLLSSCVAGLAYLFVVSAALIFGKQHMAKEKVNNK